jgi:putative glutamine amidotransferase
VKPLIGVTPGFAGPSTVREFCRSANVYYCDQNYPQRIAEAGGVPVLLTHGNGDSISSLVPLLDGLLLSGGEDVHPELYGQDMQVDTCVISEVRDGFELALIHAFLPVQRPVLAICRGVQVLNVALGGTLIQDIPVQIGSVHHSQRRDSALPSHEVRLQSGSYLAHCYSSEILSVNSHHHQAVDRLGSGLRAVAWSEEGIVEAVEHESHPYLVGVQWHPERLSSQCEIQQRLFTSFVEACREGKRARAA